jgi:hypothetical protein
LGGFVATLAMMQAFGNGMLSLLLNAVSTLYTRLSRSTDGQDYAGSVTPIAAHGIDRSLGTLDEPGGAAMLILLLLAAWAFGNIDGSNDAGLIILRLNDSPEADAAQQIVAREPR